MWSWFNFWTSGVSSVHFLDELLVLFGYASGSGAALLEGTLPLRYYTSRFARKVPTWRLPAAGEVASLLPGEGGEAGSVCAAPSVHAPSDGMLLGCVHGGGGSGLSIGRFKRVRLSRKNPACDAFQCIVGNQPRSRVWKRLKVSDSSLVADEERHQHVHLPVGAPLQDRVGVG